MSASGGRQPIVERGVATSVRSKARTATAGGTCASMGYHREVTGMTDILVRDVPDDVITAIDARASRLGLSRSEFLRRRLAQEAAAGPHPVTAQDLTAFAETFSDLNEPEVMAGAWE